jgi:hypothetical protein
MASLEILNQNGAGPEGPRESDPVAVSQAILSEARQLEHGQCARLDELAADLRAVEPANIEGNAARVAFWANLYNALLLHRLCLRPLRGSVLRHLRMFGRVAYDVGGDAYSLNLIEHGILRCNRRSPMGLRRPLRKSDRRLAAAPSRLDPRIHFALNCGARSCPPVQAYGADQLDRQLDAATQGYLEAETELDPKTGRVTLPGLLRIYSADFGGRAGQLRFAAHYLPELAALLDEQRRGLWVGHRRFDWTAAGG